MAFQIKDFTSIAASTINWMRSTTTKVTDFNIGSVVRTMLEAIAAEIDELYQQMFNGLKEAIPVSVYNSFNFDSLPAVSASGLIRVSVTASDGSAQISAGTTFTIAGRTVTYESAADTIIPAGSTFADVQVSASTSGAAGNLAASQTFTVNPAPDGFVGATNPVGFVNGFDAESPDDRKVRFNAFIASLPRGTGAAIEYGLKLTALYDSAGNVSERVVGAKIVEPWLLDSTQPISLVKCYIHNGVGGTSGGLVNRAVEIIFGYYDAQGNAVPGWKAAGVRVEIYAAEEVPVAVGAALSVDALHDHAAVSVTANEAIFNYIQSLGIGETCIMAEITQRVMEIDGVVNFIIGSPAVDVTAAFSQKLMPGAITIT